MLVIPPAVFKQVASHIKNIKEIADSHYIKVNYVSRQKKLDLLNGGGIKLEDTMELVELDNNDDDVVMTNVKLEVVYNETDSGVEQFLAIIKIRTGITDSMDAEASAPQQGKLEDQISAHEPEKVLSLREKRDFKYNYDNIFTSTFHEKLDQELAENLTVIKNTEATESLSKSFFTRYQDMIDRYKYKEMLKFRVNLPVHKYVKKLLHVIHHNSIVVITGKAGSGKSTQVPQLILDKALIDQKSACTKIMVTQPSRIAASSLAERVAAERDERIGFSVGYAARLESRESQQRGSIMYVTKEILLAELEANPGLINYSHIILDEVDERDAIVDLSMMALKEVLKKRKDLKLILMGATQNTAALSAYFDNCPVVEITSLVHPVDVYYLDDIFDLLNYKFDDQPQNRDKVIQHMAKIGLEHDTDIFCDSIKRGLLDHRSEEINLDVMLRLLMCLIHCRPGAILVILPSIGLVTRLLGAMKDSKQFPDSHFRVYPLHSKLPSLEQKIFERPPYHVRKIIVATDIADTSITIDDVVYVVDCGRVELSRGNAKGNIDTLQVEWASKANLQLRRDRAGGCGPGVCYHLVTSHQAGQLDETLLPELQRSNLLNAVLMIKKLRLGKAEEAFRNVISPPDVKTIQSAVKRLQKIGALDQEETLTPLGWHLARLPVHPAAGKLMLLGALFGCLDRAASVAAVWGYKDPFMLVTGKNSEIDKVKSHFALDEPSDHVALSEAIIDWECRRDQKSFCSDNFLSNDTMEVLSDMKQELTEDLKRIGFLPSGDVQWENRNAKNLNLFKAVVAAALYPNVAMVSWTDLQWKETAPSVSIYTDEGSVYIHLSSVCAFHPHVVPSSDPSKWQAKAKWLVYNCLKGPFLKGVTQAHTLPMLFFGEFDVTYDENYPDDCFFWLATYKVRCDLQTADMLFELRSLLNHVLASKVEVGSERAAWCSSEFKEQVLNAVIQLMIVEDEEVQPKEECVVDSNEPLPQKNNYGIEE